MQSFCPHVCDPQASTELLLVAVRRATSELHGFISWLVRVHRRMRDEATLPAEDTTVLDTSAVAAYLLDSCNACNDGLPFDRVSDMFFGVVSSIAEPTSPPGGFQDDELCELSGYSVTSRLPAAMRQLDRDLFACFSPIAERNAFHLFPVHIPSFWLCHLRAWLSPSFVVQMFPRDSSFIRAPHSTRQVFRRRARH